MSERLPWMTTGSWDESTASGDPVKITVILCTYNRCRSLPKALESIAAQAFSEPAKWEVIVLDNNSHDQTRQVVEDFIRRYPGRFRYVFEKRQGKSYALNTGIRQARGAILAFTDDDVSVEPTWLQNLTAHLDDGQWAGAGGRTRPGSAIAPPSWLAVDTHAGVLYARFDFGDAPLPLYQPPYGANMAFRKEMFERYGDFRTDLGPGPASRPIHRFGEDTEFGHRLMAAGERLRYEPSAVVYHDVPQERIRKEHFLACAFELGRYSIVQGGRGPDVCGINRQYFSVPYKLGVMLVRALRWMMAWNPQQRFDRRCLVWTSAGYLAETYRQLREKKPEISCGKTEKSAILP